MKHSEAEAHIRGLMLGVQRMRSIVREELGVESDDTINDTLENLNPWVFGAKSILPALVKVLDRIDDGKQMTPQEFYNFVFIATDLEPELAIVTSVVADKDFPLLTDMNWLRGWEAE